MLKLIWKGLKWLLFAVVLMTLFIPAAVLIWGVQEQPVLLTGQRMNYEHVTRLHRLMKDHDPRRMRAGETKQLVTVEDDLNLALQYVMSNLKDSGAKVDIDNNKATLTLSVGLQPFKLQGYLNATAALVQKGNNFWLEDIRISAIAIPNRVSRILSWLSHRLLLNFESYRNGLGAIDELKFRPDQLELTYQWRPELLKEIAIAHRELFSSPEEDERFVFYAQRIAEISRKLHIIAPAELMLKPLFNFAYLRSATEEQAALENRALLSALGVYMAGNTAQQLMGRQEKHPRERAVRRYLTLAGRYDLAQHFILSAYLSSSAGDGVADGLGLFKEFKDSQGGSGFSFADLAADRAGRKLAQLAIDPSRARNLQQQIISATNENDFMPSIESLPEGIQELEFKARFASLGSDEYRVIENEIERRLKACRAYRG